jgi:outer membrane protein, multidrug efflux system
MRKALLPWLAPLLVFWPGAAWADDAAAPPAPTPANGASAVPTDPMLAPVPQPKTTISTWEEASAHVRARSTDLRVALAEVERAEAQARAALAGMLPTLTGQAGFSNQFITTETQQVVGISGLSPVFGSVRTPFPNSASGTLTLVQPAFAPRAYWAIGTAGVARIVAGLGVEDAKRVLAVGVAQSIIAVFTAERLAELNRNGLRTALQRLAISQSRFDLGAATGLDLLRARQDVETSRATLVAGDESLRRAREALGIAIGLPEAVGVSPKATLDALERSALASCKVAPIDYRADVLVAKERIALAERSVGDARLQFSPTFNVQSAVQSTTIATGAAPNTTWNIQGILSVPIWDGGTRYATVRDAKATAGQARERLEALKRNVQIQYDQALRGVTVAETRLAVATQSRKLAFETDDLVRRSFQEGRGTSLELVTSAAQLRDAEINLALREFDLVQARVLAVLSFSNCHLF